MVSPGAILLIAVANPPVMPATPEGACVSFKVPELTEPPDVFDPVAVSDANTEEETSAVPPSAAAATIAIFAVNVPAVSKFLILNLLSKLVLFHLVHHFSHLKLFNLSGSRVLNEEFLKHLNFARLYFPNFLSF